MFAYLEGTITERQSGSLVVDCGGVGFLVSTNAATVAKCRQGERFRVYTFFNVKEDGMELFGFGTKEEKSMFTRLLTVSGVGPKVALALLNVLTVQDLSLAIVTGDTKSLTRAPGVGMKVAQRVVLELKGAVSEMDFAGDGPTAALSQEGSAAQDAVAALMALGYTGTEAAKAVGSVQDQSDRTDQIVTLALRYMAQGR